MPERENTSPTRTCAQCGAELPASTSPQLCPRCLLKQALQTEPATGPNGTVRVAGAGDASRGQPQPGEQLGHYRILRPLGGGGMGAVFEAEDLENGRRVALKVLSQALDSPEARERFFREGRLAASINHPNSVYVFGTEEIAGTPVIAMELVAGGTLEERVRERGPMPPTQAVDAVLQIIGGLEAAQRIGILHRDVKPSNCFVDADGTVKIGDFGLSISTAVRVEPLLTAPGSLLGTPAFCSPEQLRGEELNPRADMYSVGATLFYLLTGRTPFQARNVVALIATVLEQPAPSPRQVRPEVPPGLAKVVRRCLEKQPGERFKTYDELWRALAPYGSTPPAPAPLGQRFLAGVLDICVISLTGALLFLPGFGKLAQEPLMVLNLIAERSWKGLIIVLAGFTASLLYYAVLEGFWGATAGKAICRLRVVGPDGNPPGFWRALGRAVLYLAVPALPSWIVLGANPRGYLGSSQAAQMLAGFSCYAMLALLFSTARRRNGLAAIHDLATKTRVISKLKLLARPVPLPAEAPPPAVETRPAVGPYHVLQTLEETAAGAWLLGYDLRLLRRVWLRVAPPGAPPVPPALRNLGRPGRLRWLTGRRAPQENWDAFEALTGQPLAHLVRQPQPWSQVRYWLYDLAREISAARKDGTLPPVLALDRVWITAEGRAKLLDFPAPGLGPASGLDPARTPPAGAIANTPPPLDETTRPQLFLDETAAASWAGQPSAAAGLAGEARFPLPQHARAFLQSLPRLADTEAVVLALGPLLQRPVAVSRWRRAAVTAGCIAFPVFACLMLYFGASLIEQWTRRNPGLMQLSNLLQQRWTMRVFHQRGRRPSDQQFAIYIASHYRSAITNAQTWSNPFSLRMISGEARRFAQQSVAEHPAPTAAEIAEADAAIKPLLPAQDLAAMTRTPSFPLMIVGTTLAIYVALPALLAALLFRGGLVLRIAGIVFVRKDGARASRLRLLWRAMVAWSPVWGSFILVAAGGQRLAGWVPWLAAAVVCALALVSTLLPARGLPDRLAGTWPVPR